VFTDGVKPVHTFAIGADHFSLYTGLVALLLNIVVAVIAQAALGMTAAKPARVR
jgi:SSS family solute:Na+ symporter